MKKGIILALLLVSPVMFAETVSDEVYLDAKIEEAQENLRRYREEKARVEREREEEQKRKEAETRAREKQKHSVSTNIDGSGRRIITTTTTTTTTTVIDNGGRPASYTPVEPSTPTVAPLYTPAVTTSSIRPLSPARLIVAESLGICVPGLGLAHFTLGNTRGGTIALTMTGLAAVGYIGAQIGVETRAIDNPNVYSALHWGSIALFAASYLYDIIGAPIYYFNYNKKARESMVYIEPLDIRGDNYAFVDKQGINVSIAKLNFVF
jgi:hypothetical protein